jgi:hypothetical protein
MFLRFIKKSLAISTVAFAMAGSNATHAGAATAKPLEHTTPHCVVQYGLGNNSAGAYSKIRIKSVEAKFFCMIGTNVVTKAGTGYPNNGGKMPGYGCGKPVPKGHWLFATFPRAKVVKANYTVLNKPCKGDVKDYHFSARPAS